MTLPYERVSAVLATRNFLYELLDPKCTPRVPKAIRQRAAQVLRHYPLAVDFDDVRRAFGEGTQPTKRVR